RLIRAAVSGGLAVALDSVLLGAAAALVVVLRRGLSDREHVARRRRAAGVAGLRGLAVALVAVEHAPRAVIRGFPGPLRPILLLRKRVRTVEVRVPRGFVAGYEAGRCGVLALLLRLR